MTSRSGFLCHTVFLRQQRTSWLYSLLIVWPCITLTYSSFGLLSLSLGTMRIPISQSNTAWIMSAHAQDSSWSSGNKDQCWHIPASPGQYQSNALLFTWKQLGHKFCIHSIHAQISAKTVYTIIVPTSELTSWTVNWQSSVIKLCTFLLTSEF